MKVLSAWAVLAALSQPAWAAGAKALDVGNAHAAGLLWKATSPKGTLYLLGSIQADLPKTFAMPAHIEAAFAHSAALIVEQLPSSEEQGLDAFLDDHGAYPSGDDIFRHLPTGYGEKLRKFAAAKELPPDNLGSLRPWVILLMTGQWPLLSAAIQPGSGIEGYFIHRAEGKKPIYGIETERFEDGLLASIPEGIQIEILKSFLDATTTPSPKEPNPAERKIAAWIAGNSNEVLKGEIGVLDHYSAVRRMLLDERNAPMAAFAGEKLKAGGYWFMCVNAAHMLGPTGIVARLRSAGFSVTAEGS